MARVQFGGNLPVVANAENPGLNMHLALQAAKKYKKQGELLEAGWATPIIAPQTASEGGDVWVRTPRQATELDVDNLPKLIEGVDQADVEQAQLAENTEFNKGDLAAYAERVQVQPGQEWSEPRFVFPLDQPNDEAKARTIVSLMVDRASNEDQAQVYKFITHNEEAKATLLQGSDAALENALQQTDGDVSWFFRENHIGREPMLAVKTMSNESTARMIGALARGNTLYATRKFQDTIPTAKREHEGLLQDFASWLMGS